jgi:hypothetical protein
MSRKTGIVGLSTRLAIRESDNTTGSYPPNIRTVGRPGGAKGNSNIKFDDTRTILFNQKENGNYPIGLDSSEINKHDMRLLVSHDNELPDITAPVSASGFLSTQGLMKSIDYDMSAKPFDESRIYLADMVDVPFYATGTNRNVYPGFESPLRDKFIIKLDVSNTSEKLVSRYNNAGGVSEANSGQFAGPQIGNSGFMYYNNDLNRWEEMGITHPADGTSLGYRMYISGAAGTVGSEFDQGNFDVTHANIPMYQFKMSDHTGYLATSTDQLEELGYKKIGAPTRTGQGPYHFKYHATSSQTINMSDYLTAPFVLEAGVLTIPITAQMALGHVPEGQNSALARVANACRDIDNYTFFLYRQSRVVDTSRHKVDSPVDVNESKRYLVMSGCATFFNSKAFVTSSVQESVSEKLPHDPTFSYDWDATVVDNVDTLHQFTGTLVIHMKPTVPSGQFLGGTRFPFFAEAPNSTTFDSMIRSVVLSDVWDGGTSVPSSTYGPIYYPADFDFQSVDSYAYPNYVDIPYWQMGKNNTFAASFQPFKPSASPATPVQFTSDEVPEDHRPFANFSGIRTQAQKALPWTYPVGTNVQHGKQLTLGSLETVVESPYLIMPGDRLILGLDAGISMIPNSGSDLAFLPPTSASLGADGLYIGKPAGLSEDFSCMSGSLMRIQTGGASLVLYGSLVKEDREIMFESNQNLTSPAIHESIGSERITDQFNIYTQKDRAGTYTDRVIAGNQIISDGHYAAGAPTVANHFLRGAYGMFSIDGTYGTNGINLYLKPAFSFAASNRILVMDPFRLDRELSALDNNSHVRSAQPFVPHVCGEERYYDSIMPDIKQLADRTHSVEFFGTDSTSKTRGMRLLSGSLQDITESMSFPYDGNPDRKLSDIYTLALTKDQIFSNKIFLGTAAKRRASIVTQKTLVDTILFQKGYLFKVDSGATPAGADISFKHSRLGAQCYLYGIKNVRPQNTFAIFRSDRFGQFRDMLEQRSYAKFFLKEKKSSVGRSPITVRFVKSLDGATSASPGSTDSGNISTEYTSSRPYFDRDRSARTADATVATLVGVSDILGLLS